jgi:hypothetical protein
MSSKDLNDANPELAERVRWVMSKVASAYITSVHRSTAEQTVLWNKWQEGIRRWGTPAKAIANGYVTAARPGYSKHEYTINGPARSEAVDLNCAYSDRNYFKSVISDAGLYQPIASEYWHLQLRPDRGPLPDGISTPPQIEDEEDMNDTARTYRYPDGSVITVNEDGSTAHLGVPGHGNIFSLKPEQHLTFTRAVAIAPHDADDKEAGYVILNENGDEYHFPAG